MNHFECMVSLLHKFMPYDKLYNFIDRTSRSFYFQTKSLQDPRRFMMLVERHKCKNPGHCLFAALFIHLLHENIDPHLHAGIPDSLHAANQLNNRPRGDGMRKIDSIRRNGNTPQSGKTRRGDKCNLIHHR